MAFGNIRAYMVAALAVMMSVQSCKDVPDDVIQPEEMADLMADINVAESITESDVRSYATDSSRQALKQAVLQKHNVTIEQFDSALSWYGRNMSFFMDVNDRTIEILEQRQAEYGSRIATESALSVSGDSVDVWPNPRFYTFNAIAPLRTLTFDFRKDQTWEAGDVYTWRGKFINNPEASTWGLGAEYADGSFEYATSTLNGDGWREVMLLTDSTREAPVRIYGFLTVNRSGQSPVWLDSVMMVRSRLDKSLYGRRYRQKRFTRYRRLDN